MTVVVTETSCVPWIRDTSVKPYR